MQSLQGGTRFSSEDFSHFVVKNILLTASLLFACVSAFGQGLSLSAGQSYTFTFDSMVLVGPNTSPDELYDAGFSFPASSGFPGNSTVSLSLFEVFSPDSPFLVQDFQGFSSDDAGGIEGGEANGGLIGFVGQASPAWQDQQGMMVLTVISGSISLDGMAAKTVIGGNQYEAAVSVPEPPGVILCAIGLSFSMLLFRQRFV